jgi:hypothetical protein
LRPAKDLNPLDVGQFKIRTRKTTPVNVVHVNRDCRLGGHEPAGLFRAATKRNLKARRVRSQRQELEIWDDLVEIDGLFDALIDELFSAKRSDRDRRCLQIALATLGRDDDIAELIIAGFYALRIGRRGHHCDDHRKIARSRHDPLPDQLFSSVAGWSPPRGRSVSSPALSPRSTRSISCARAAA